MGDWKLSTKRSVRKTRIEDVAAEAGVSIMTVSRAMRGVEGVSAVKRSEILRIAARIGYAPNRVAGSLATSKSTLIGVSVPTLFDAVFAEIFNGMRGVFQKAGFQTVIDTSEYEAAREEKWIERVLAWNPAGIILSGLDHTENTRNLIRSARTPTLEIWDHSAHPIDLCVGIDHFKAGFDMGVFLAGLGYRRPAYVGTEPGRDSRAEQRFAGFCKGFQQSGVTVDPVIQIHNTPSFEGGRLGARQALETGPASPDVLYFLNDHMAFGGMMECEASNLGVPEDIGIAGFNGLNINNVLPKPITTGITPRKEMGEQSARMLVCRILDVKTDPTLLLPVTHFAGETTRAQ